MHLGALQKMFPFFAARSHTNYTDSVWSYMRRMEGRDIKNSKLLQKYIEVYHVLRPADKPAIHWWSCTRKRIYLIS